MQIPTTNPVLQALSGAQETGAVRQQAATTKVETAQAVRAPEKSESGKQNQLRTQREPEDDDNHNRTKLRGGLVDIVV